MNMMEWSPAGRVLMVTVVSCFLHLGCSQEYLSDINHGCYFDGPERALQHLITCSDGSPVCQSSCGENQPYCLSSSAMTIDFCRTLCRRRNLRYYALEAGKVCFCGGGLSDPFKYSSAEGAQTNCSRPCTGNPSQTCGGEFKMQVYEFQEPVVNSTCFHPGFVKQAFITEGVAIRIGQKIRFICIPLYSLLGDAVLTCQPDRTWLPNNMLPFCNYTGIQYRPTAANPIVEMTTLAEVNLETTAALPKTTNADFLPYYIDSIIVLFFLGVVGIFAICVWKKMKQMENDKRDIRPNPEPAPNFSDGYEEARPDAIPPTNGVLSSNAGTEHNFGPGPTFSDRIYHYVQEAEPPSSIYLDVIA